MFMSTEYSKTNEPHEFHLCLYQTKSLDNELIIHRIV